MAFDSSLPHALPWNYPWLKDEIERRDEYIAQLEAELAHQRPQNDDSGAIDGESVKVPAESETEAHSEPDSREKLLGDLERLTQTWHDYDGNFMRVYGGVAYAQVKELLDRQAAITERYWMQINGANASANIVLNKRIAELEEENDALREWKTCYERMRDERDELVKQRNRAESEAKTQRNNYEQASFARSHWQKKVQKAEAERDKLKADLNTALGNNESLRYELMLKLAGKPKCEVCDRTTMLTEIEGLIAERDEWKAECEDLEHANNRQARKIHDVCEANSKLTAERDLYRAALGKAKDAAEEIGRL